jgi:hypothetical protein
MRAHTHITHHAHTKICARTHTHTPITHAHARTHVHAYHTYTHAHARTQRLVLRGNPELTGALPAALLTGEADRQQELRFEIDGTQLQGAFASSSGSAGNNGGVPYKAALLEKGAASNYPKQRRRVTGVGDSLYRSGL